MNEAETILLKKFGCLDRRQLFEKSGINYTQLDIIISAMLEFVRLSKQLLCPHCKSKNVTKWSDGELTCFDCKKHWIN